MSAKRRQATAARLEAGNVYITRVPDGRYAIVRVVRVLGRGSLVSTSQYLERERPSLDDPRIRRTVSENRFFHRGGPATLWLDGRPPDNFELLGRIRQTDEEAEQECSVYGGKWHAATGNEAYLEWRWLNDRAAFEEEVRQRQAEAEQRKRRSQKPKKMMDEGAFWSVIALLDWSQEGNDENVLAPAVATLASKSALDIRRFEERLAYCLYKLDTKAHATSAAEGDSGHTGDTAPGYVSADAFLYARCVAVANGREFYDDALTNPSRMPLHLEFESLLRLAQMAYELKTGEEFDYSTGCSYESFSNPDGWAT